MVIGFKGPAAGGFSAGALVLERPDAHSVCAKLESETFADEAQLVVGEQDCAVISRDGWVAGILGPGRHTLSARIQPFLGSLASTSGYAARISFVTTAPIEDVRFGGPVTLPGAAQVMAFGTLATRVVDPGRLATNLGPATSEDLGRFLGAKILQLVSACAIEGSTSTSPSIPSVVLVCRSRRPSNHIAFSSQSSVSTCRVSTDSR